jgi:hypothetical protein
MFRHPIIFALVLIFNSCHTSLATKKISPQKSLPSHAMANHLAKNNSQEDKEADEEAPGGESRRTRQPIEISFE